jgi:hypothetical protein
VRAVYLDEQVSFLSSVAPLVVRVIDYECDIRASPSLLAERMDTCGPGSPPRMEMRSLRLGLQRLRGRIRNKRTKDALSRTSILRVDASECSRLLLCSIGSWRWLKIDNNVSSGWICCFLISVFFMATALGLKYGTRYSISRNMV